MGDISDHPLKGRLYSLIADSTGSAAESPKSATSFLLSRALFEALRLCHLSECLC